MKRLLVVLGCGLILLGLGYSQRATIAERLLAAALPKQLGTNQLAVLHYHVVPPIMVPGQEALWLTGAGDIFPDYTVGYGGVSFSLPANSSEIIQTRKGM